MNAWRRSPRLILVACFLLTVVCCSCQSAAPVTSAGACGTRRTGTTLALLVDWRKRTVIVHVPAAYSGGSAVALVLNLHGSASSASAQQAFSGMDATADAADFIVAYPQGAIPAESGYDWDVPGQPLLGGAPVAANAPNDETFLQQTIGALEQRYCIDRQRVYATGFSGGARMVSQLGCDLPDVIAAIAPVSGLRMPDPCSAARPMPVIAFHGTVDPVDPSTGNGQAYWTEGVMDAATRWSRHDACAANPSTTTPTNDVQLMSFAGCGGGAAVELYTITGAGHTWPGGPKLPASVTRILGPQSNGVNADALIWGFFQQHPLKDEGQ